MIEILIIYGGVLISLVLSVLNLFYIIADHRWTIKELREDMGEIQRKQKAREDFDIWEDIW